MSNKMIWIEEDKILATVQAIAAVDNYAVPSKETCRRLAEAQHALMDAVRPETRVAEVRVPPKAAHAAEGTRAESIAESIAEQLRRHWTEQKSASRCGCATPHQWPHVSRDSTPGQIDAAVRWWTGREVLAGTLRCRISTRHEKPTAGGTWLGGDADAHHYRHMGGKPPELPWKPLLSDARHPLRGFQIEDLGTTYPLAGDVQ